jgi:hypothetical protein
MPDIEVRVIMKKGKLILRIDNESFKKSVLGVIEEDIMSHGTLHKILRSK